MDSRLDINIFSISNFPNNCLCGYISLFLVNICYLGAKGHIFYNYLSTSSEKNMYIQRMEEWYSKCGRLLTIGKPGWRVYGNSLHGSCNFFISLRLFQNRKLKKMFEQNSFSVPQLLARIKYSYQHK